MDRLSGHNESHYFIADHSTSGSVLLTAQQGADPQDVKTVKKAKGHTGKHMAQCKLLRGSVHSHGVISGSADHTDGLVRGGYDAGLLLQVRGGLV